MRMGTVFATHLNMVPLESTAGGDYYNKRPTKATKLFTYSFPLIFLPKTSRNFDFGGNCCWFWTSFVGVGPVSVSS